MRIVNLRAHSGIYFHKGLNASIGEAAQLLEDLTFNSAPINIGRELVARGQASSYCEWRFWGYPTNTYFLNGIPVTMHYSKDEGDLTEFEKHLSVEGEPDVIWAEGIHFPQTLKNLFDLCPRSIKIIYSKYCEPWLIEGLEHYDACLVDEPWQIEEMRNRHPSVACRVWDKLVDYEHQFFPTHSDKKYDICYVARLHPRKYHELLFSALSKITDRRMSVVLVGSNDTDNQKYLEPLAREAGVAATFTGHVSAREVNNKD